MAQPSVFTLQPHQIESNWPWIEPFLLKVEGADWEPIDIKQALQAGQAQLWGAHLDGLVLGIWVTRIENVGSRKRGLLWIAVGSPLDAGLELFRRHTEPWFKQQGCTHSQIVGRRGWKRILPDYLEAGLILEKQL